MGALTGSGRYWNRREQRSGLASNRGCWISRLPSSNSRFRSCESSASLRSRQRSRDAARGGNGRPERRLRARRETVARTVHRRMRGFSRCARRAQIAKRWNPRWTAAADYGLFARGCSCRVFGQRRRRECARRRFDGFQPLGILRDLSRGALRKASTPRWRAPLGYFARRRAGNRRFLESLVGLELSRRTRFQFSYSSWCSRISRLYGSKGVRGGSFSPKMRAIQ